MAGRVVLQHWPSAHDCLSWSDDDRLAVAGGERFTVLSPVLHSSITSQAYREKVVVRANAFTRDEVPLLQPLDPYYFSPAEEQSARHVTALAWSNPGLSRHGKCILAVLSSNHILSLWESVGSLASEESWIRRTIVNHALIRHYDAFLGPADSNDRDRVDDHQELKQMSQRVTAFCWASRDFHQFMSQKHDRHILVVATGAGDLLVVTVKSPYDILSPQIKDWHLEVVARCNLDWGVTSRAQSSSRFGPRRTPTVDSIAWGRLDDYGYAPIAYTINGILHAIDINIGRDSTTPFSLNESSQRHLTERRTMLGPLRFVPGTRLLVAFADNAVVCLDLENEDPTEEPKDTSHGLDGRWDPVTGTSISISQGQPTLHVASLISSSAATTASLSLPELQPRSSPTQWQDQIKESRAEYTTSFGVKNVRECVMGMSASPFGDYIATATIVHPRDGLAYAIRSDEKVFIDITQESDPSGDHLEILKQFHTPCPVPAEAMLFRLRRQLDQEERAQVNPSSRADLTQQIADCLRSKPNSAAKLQRGPAQLAADLKQQILDADKSVEIRSKRLAAALVGEPGPPGHDAEVVQLLVSAVLTLAEGMNTTGTISQKILGSYKYLQTQLADSTCSTDRNPPVDDCTFCGEQMQFQSTKWARCARDHQFTRCALTFLPVEKPEVSKTCSLCYRIYLDEFRMPTLGHNQGEETRVKDGATGVGPDSQTAGKTEPPASLARILFAACEVCVHCGGQFQTEE